MLIAAGHRGVHTLSIRQVCNVQLAMMMRDRDGVGREDLMRELRSPLDPMAQEVWRDRQWAARSEPPF